MAIFLFLFAALIITCVLLHHINFRLLVPKILEGRIRRYLCEGSKRFYFRTALKGSSNHIMKIVNKILNPHTHLHETSHFGSKHHWATQPFCIAIGEI